MDLISEFWLRVFDWVIFIVITYFIYKEIKEINKEQ